jgi:hypothetical protein
MSSTPTSGAGPPPLAEVQTKEVTEYKGAVANICGKNTEGIRHVVFEKLRWDRTAALGQIRELDAVRVNRLRIAVLTDNIIQCPVTVVVWNDEGMCTVSCRFICCIV